MNQSNVINDKSKKMIPPIFISGFNKSGTTLLLSLLDDHNELMVFPEELHYFKNLIMKKDKLKAIENNTGFFMFFGEEYLNEFSQGKSWYNKGYPFFDKKKFHTAIKRILTNKKFNWRTTFNEIFLEFSNFAFIEKKKTLQLKYWVSKTTQDEILFPSYKKIFETFYFFYVVRDPRDVFCSYSKRNSIINKKDRQEKDLLNFIALWKTQVNEAIKYQNRDSFFQIIRYEDLVENPKKTMGDIAQKTNISFIDSLFYPTRLGQKWQGNSVFNTSFDNISSKPIGRYKSALKKKEIDILNCFLKSEISTFKYGNQNSKPFFELISLTAKIKYNYLYAISLTKQKIKYAIKQKIYILYFKIFG